MEERKYSLSEIDRMRLALMKIINPSGDFVVGYHDGCQAVTRQAGFFNESQRCQGEDMLRTYLLGGVSPEELEAEAVVSLAKCAERDAQYERDAQKISSKVRA